MSMIFQSSGYLFNVLKIDEGLAGFFQCASYSPTPNPFDNPGKRSLNPSTMN